MFAPKLPVWYTSFGPGPEAYITSKKSRLKVYDSKNIYLKDESNFEIELHNPTSIRYMAKIWINGKLVSKSGIVINANQRVYLERFIDENAKFVFKTFEVDNVEETKTAREKNGLVKVEFYPEIQTIRANNITTVTPPVFYDAYLYKTGDSIGCGYSTYSTSTSFSEPIMPRSSKLLRETSFNKATTDSIETGRVAQGEKSSQSFTNTVGDFTQTPYFTYEIQLLPESLKAVEASEIRNYCGECGVRIKKSNWKYCPNCGEKL
jgi:hypothetical protein